MEQNTDDKLAEDASSELSFDAFKKALGSAAAKYSDTEIEHMRVICDRLADVYFDSWLKRLNTR